MPIFQQTILETYIKNIPTQKLEQAWQTFTKHFHNPEVQENIQNAKEEQYQEGFLKDLFVQVFGYVLNPNPNFNLTTELKNIRNAQKTDGAILQNDSALAVIELKSTSLTNLDRVEKQAFGYKNNQPRCIYVITSNFEKLRFYIDNAIDFEEFNLFTLTKEEFAKLWLCLDSDSLLKNLPQKIKTESISKGEDITLKLYKDYKAFRDELFADIQKRNKGYDKLTLFKKTQKLLDRFLFAFFAEDKLLIPPNSVRKVIQQLTDLRDKYDAYFPLYERFKKFFGYINEGHESEEDKIFAYNGGLFAPDDLLDNLKIEDGILYKHTFKIAEYNFNKDVSVNILGHIFEHSLNEIEELQAQSTPFGGRGARKQDGIFYTPKYITQYIVEETVGKLCAEKKEEFEIVEEYYKKGRKGRRKTTIKNLQAKLEKYRTWLLDIKICDPACGSGAFLNQALEFLIEEHKYIDELQAKLLGQSIVLREVENQILENNIFGVDLNIESVEIAKLSLWLRTAKQGRKLLHLRNNIKAGNSLIEDPNIAGEKAFIWAKEFPTIFQKGGFDVIIGNPPYGASIPTSELEYLITKYKTQGISKSFCDSYTIFYIALLEQVKEKGFLSFIAPNTWRLIESAKKFRNYILADKLSVLKMVQHKEKVFGDATVDVDTVVLQKQGISPQSDVQIVVGKVNGKAITHTISQRFLQKQEFINLLMTQEMYDLQNKIKQHSFLVKDYFDIKNGVKPYEVGKGKPPQTRQVLNDKPFTSEKQEDFTFSPLIGGSQFHQYTLLWQEDYWIKYGVWLAAPRDAQIFEAKEKLIFRQTADTLIGHYITEGFVMRNNTHIILAKNQSFHLKYLLALLNSKLNAYYYWSINPEKGEALAEVKAFHLGLMLFPKQKVNQQFFVAQVDTLLSLNTDKQKMIRKFQQTILNNLPLQKLSKKLQNFYEFDFKTFLEELKKKKIKLKFDEQDEWSEYFENYRKKIGEMIQQTLMIENEINQEIYQLYQLTPKEIEIIESGN